MSSTLFQIENLVGLIKLREQGVEIPDFEKYDDMACARMLCSLAVTHLDTVTTRVNGEGSE